MKPKNYPRTPLSVTYARIQIIIYLISAFTFCGMVIAIESSNFNQLNTDMQMKVFGFLLFLVTFLIGLMGLISVFSKETYGTIKLSGKLAVAYGILQCLFSWLLSLGIVWNLVLK